MEIEEDYCFHQENDEQDFEGDRSIQCLGFDFDNKTELGILETTFRTKETINQTSEFDLYQNCFDLPQSHLPYLHNQLILPKNETSCVNFQSQAPTPSDISSDTSILNEEDPILTIEYSRSLFGQALEKMGRITEQSSILSKEHDKYQTNSSLSTNNSSNDSFNSKPSKFKSQEENRIPPHLIIQRVRYSCLKYFILPERKFVYIGRILEINIQREDNDNFIHFLRNLKIHKKWEGIKRSWEVQNKFFVHVFLTCIGKFLSNEGQEDFNDWMDDGNSKSIGFSPTSKDKEWIQERFRKELREFQRVT